MDGPTKQALLEEILELSAPPAPVGPDEFTAAEFLAHLRRSEPAATRAMADDRIRRLLDQSVLVRREASLNGRRCWAYRKAVT